MKFLRNSRFTKPMTDFVGAEYFHSLLLMFSTVVFVFFSTIDYIPMGLRFAIPILLTMLVSVREMRYGLFC